MEIFGFLIVHGALDATETSLVIIEQDRWYSEIFDLPVVQDPASYGWPLSAKRSEGKRGRRQLPSNGLDLGNSPRIKEYVRDSAVSRPDINRDDQLSGRS